MDWCMHCDCCVEGETHTVKDEDGDEWRCCNFCDEPVSCFDEDAGRDR